MNRFLSNFTPVLFWVMLHLLLLLPVHSHGSPETSFVRSTGKNFVLNGRLLHVNGFNSYWLMWVASDTDQRHKVTSAFKEAADHGLNVARTWAFNDGNGYHALQTSPGVYDEQVFQALDFVICEAQKYGIKLILSFVNNYKDFGGRAQYVQWENNATGLQISEDDFYTNPTVKSYYKNHVNRIMTRNNSLNGVVYKDDPTIFAWELINEPRCQIDPSGRTVQRWVKEMASYVKSIDSNHLLEVGMEGFYGDSVPIRKQFNPNGLEFGTDFITINQLPGIDFATVHAYPDSWLAGSDDKVQLLFLKKWMKVHIKDATKVLKKPILFAEFGKSYKDPGYNISERNKFYKTVYENIYKAAKTGKVGGGGLFWQLVAEGMESLADGYEIVLSQNPSTAALVSFQSRRLSALDL
ncbi:mannan endo-1,4-beta-mannosidase 1 isoform X1 [Cryptomeria japonica]|uniref:mannan endo-1,4-beta-mannosidase 1 isoform X1 n=1 Tax=Cryptomeria japonica TaxID=3369 RepID=UPI0025AB871A|nr:mannan endo-1,4-beta-mannosidase 1 isoform X1 [Cryptomeria japonica]